MYRANTCKWQTFTAHAVLYCTNWLKAISCQEQFARLLVVIHHENIHELASLRFLKLNLEYQQIKMGRRTCEHILFNSFMRLCSKSCNRIPQLFLSSILFLKNSYYNSYTWLKNVTLALTSIKLYLLVCTT